MQLQLHLCVGEGKVCAKGFKFLDPNDAERGSTHPRRFFARAVLQFSTCLPFFPPLLCVTVAAAGHRTGWGGDRSTQVEFNTTAKGWETNTGTTPAGSTWRKNPIPSGLWQREGPTFEPVCQESQACIAGYSAWPHLAPQGTCKCSGYSNGGQSISNDHIAPLWCWGQNTLRIQNKQFKSHVIFQALYFPTSRSSTRS